MSAENNYTVQEFNIVPFTGNVNVDLSINSLASFEYYEDILSPTVTAKASFAIVDVKGLPQGFEIYGGEKVNIAIDVSGSTKKLYLNDDKSRLFVRSATVDKRSNLGMYTIEMVSREMITNETARLVNRFDGKVSDSAKLIFAKLKSQKSLNVEDSVNKYSFIGNTKRPFDLLLWLCPKAVPTGTKGFGTAGYLFFETQDGYNFRSIDKLITQASSFTYEKTEAVDPYSNKNKFRILSATVAKNNDILTSLRMGMYANKSLFYNLYTNEINFTEYKLSTKYASISKSASTSSYPKLPEGIENSFSRLLTRTLDVGNLTDAGKIEGNENLPKYQSEAAVRYNLLFSQILNVVIPCNLDLRAGQVITCNIAESTAGSKNKTFESQQSGNYMIANLCHRFQGNQGYTMLSLVRDSYELKTGYN